MDNMEVMPIDGKNIYEWLVELDTIAQEVEAELVSRDIGCHLAEVLEAVNKVIFESRGFKSAILLSVIYMEEKFNKDSDLKMPLLRPQELRLAISERLIILQPHNWALRRDYGMMLYYNREYEAVVQELSICIAFAPEEEAEVLEPFVEKLHLMRLETSWKSLGQKGGRLTVP
ncbi:hypothetical protein Sango_2761600 [Sesamum angolense]|uniref:Uncharacterized protein n=1 Tax=Sesamum angolense TaxID=2727404 RepID=A0AAE1T8Q6_9LAMI|nr:hypothetical protein Sango_2761600 [Sesamum angolense]